MNDNDLITRREVELVLLEKGQKTERYKWGEQWELNFSEIREALSEYQSELVRCKDCKYAHLTYNGECKYCDLDEDENGFIEATYRPGDWFCAGGERKEERDCGQAVKQE